MPDAVTKIPFPRHCKHVLIVIFHNIYTSIVWNEKQHYPFLTANFHSPSVITFPAEKQQKLRSWFATVLPDSGWRWSLFLRGGHLNHAGESESLWTHWGWDKMDAISQTTFWSAFSWIKMFEFRLKFHWSLFLRVQLTIFQHWFR